MAKSTENVSVSAEDDLKATKSNSNPRPFGPPKSTVAPLSVPYLASSAVMKRTKKPSATDKLPRSWRKLAFESGRTIFTFFLASSIPAKSAPFSQSRSPSIG